MTEKLILVTGATGRQGSAVVRHVLQRGFAVRAITRNTDKPAAQALKSQGVDLFKADMEDRASLGQAIKGVQGVFCVQNYWEKGIGYAGEIRQARNLIQVATDAQINHFVFSSVAGCDNARGVEHFESKWEIEKMVDSAQLPRTFIRTVLFMDNFVDPKNGPLVFPGLAGALKPTTQLHMIAVDDIGWFVAEAFAHPDQYLGKTIEIAGDSLTVAEMKQVYMNATGKQPPNFKIPFWLLRILNAETARQFHWNNEVGWHFDIQKVRQLHPELISFDKFWRAQQMAE
jgi:uncharacterized protein YbjT (DUF2867 family)